MTKLTASASAPHFLPEDATLTYYQPLNFKINPDGGIRIGDNYDWKNLRFNISGQQRTAVRVDENNQYFYRDGWADWTNVLDASSSDSFQKALRRLKKRPVDDMPLELGIRMPAALAVTIAPIPGIDHPLENKASLWSEEGAVKYLASLPKSQANALQTITHLNRNTLDWALLQRQMRVAEQLWTMGIRPSPLAQDLALGWWALSGGFAITPHLDDVEKRYPSSSEATRKFLAAVRAQTPVQNPLFNPKDWHGAWDTLLVVWLERLQDLPSQVNHRLTFAAPGANAQEVQRTAFQHWLSTQRSVSSSDPKATQQAWLHAMKEQQYDFKASHADPILLSEVAPENALETLADQAGVGGEQMALLSSLIRSAQLEQRLPGPQPRAGSPKPRF